VTDTTDWLRWIERSVPVKPEMTNGRVLLVSYLFPPTGGSGIYRPTALAKHLPENGWDVAVLTAAHDRFPWQDDSLMTLVPENCPVHRVAGYEPACLAKAMTSFFSRKTGREARGSQFTDSPTRSRHGSRLRRWIEDRIYWRLIRQTNRLGWGDGQSLWTGPAVRAGIRQYRRQPFDAVISTGPPHFAHEVAMRIAHRLHLPWVADLRDPLVSDFDRNQPASKQTAAMRQLEAAVMQHSDCVITTCQSLAADLLRRYLHRSSSNVLSVTNGFDRASLREVARLVESSRQGEMCRFVAAGSFYGRREISRIVEPIRAVLTRRPEWNGRVRLTIAGTVDAEQRRAWEANRPDWLELAGYVERNKALELTAKATCNIVVVPDCDHGGLSVPGKTFELLALPRHVLTLVPPGSDTEQIVSAAGGATCVPFEQTEHVADAIERIVADHFAGQLNAQRDWDRIDRYDRWVIGERFADVLGAVVTKKARAVSTPACSPSVSDMVGAS
jgi:hypothetical protein